MTNREIPLEGYPEDIAAIFQEPIDPCEGLITELFDPSVPELKRLENLQALRRINDQEDRSWPPK